MTMPEFAERLRNMGTDAEIKKAMEDMGKSHGWHRDSEKTIHGYLTTK